jgi:hypothetical protein
VARLLRGFGESDPDFLGQTAELTGLDIEQVRIAARYYSEYRDELDDWIRRLDDLAQREEAIWEREQELLHR